MVERADDDNANDTSIKQTQHQHQQTNANTHAADIHKQANLALVGLPPHDLIDALAAALRAAGLDVDEVFSRAVSCSNEFLCPVAE